MCNKKMWTNAKIDSNLCVCVCFFSSIFILVKLCPRILCDRLSIHSQCFGIKLRWFGIKPIEFDFVVQKPLFPLEPFIPYTFIHSLIIFFFFKLNGKMYILTKNPYPAQQTSITFNKNC